MLVVEVFLWGFGGGNMMSSLTPFRGTSLGIMLSNFPVFGGGIGSIISSCSLTLLLQLVF